MKTYSEPFASVKPRIAITVSPGVYRLSGHELAILNYETNTCLVIEQGFPPQKKEENKK